MEKKSQIQELWHECFPADSGEWLRMFFAQVYTDDCALTVEVNGAIVSSLLLLPYAMTFHGDKIAAGYIYGAGTKEQYREHGYMGRLMTEALAAAKKRGDMLVFLVPATPRLFSYYAKFGFSTVFYRKIQRYSSAHRFHVSAEYKSVVDDGAIPELYDAFRRMMARRSCCTQHTREQFLTTIDDVRACGGHFVAMSTSAGKVCAMLWGVPDESGDIVVTELLADSPDAGNAVTAGLQQLFPGKPLTVYAMASDGREKSLTPYAMARIVCPGLLLSVIAEKNPLLRINVKVKDDILPDNDAVYCLAGGVLNILPYDSNDVTPDIAVGMEALTSGLFSNKETGDVIGIPAMRPHASLLLD